MRSPLEEYGIDHSHLPRQQGFKIDTAKLDLDSYTLQPGGADVPQVRVARAFGGNDYHVTYKEADPGYGLPWHLHSPTNYQLGIPIQGAYEWHYVDNDGKEHSAEIGPGEIAFLPPGAHNKLEVVGDETHKAFVIENEAGVPRIENIIGETKNYYDPWNDPVWGLWYDTYRGKVWEMDENAVTRY